MLMSGTTSEQNPEEWLQRRCSDDAHNEVDSPVPGASDTRAHSHRPSLVSAVQATASRNTAATTSKPANASSRSSKTTRKSARGSKSHRHRSNLNTNLTINLNGKTPVSAAYLAIGAWANSVVRRGVTRLRRVSDPVHLELSSSSSDSDSQSHVLSARQRTHTYTSISASLSVRDHAHHVQARELAQMPTEVLFKILSFLPSSNLACLLLTAPNLAAVSAHILSARPHFITSLEDLRSFTHDIPYHLLQQPSTSVESYATHLNSDLIRRNSGLSKPFQTYFTHLLKKKQIGPIFYRSGTMILFARHFTRLIPEARVLLGVGYAMVLAWFMCLFYSIPFLGALTLYFSMDLVDLWIRSVASLLHSTPLSLLYFILPKTHRLHPLQPVPQPNIPALLIRRLTFSAAIAPITSNQNEPPRCCGLAGTAWNSHPSNLSHTSTSSIETTISGSIPTSPTDTPHHNHNHQHSTTKQPAFWGLMSSYTPWHLYLLTKTLSNHPLISHLTLQRISLAWWFRLHPAPDVQVLVLHTCEVDETGIGLVAQAFRGLQGLVLRGSEVRCGGWDMESIRRASTAAVGEIPLAGSNSVTPGTDSTTSIDPEKTKDQIVKGWWRPARNGVGRQSLLPEGVSVFETIRVVRFEMCNSACAVDAVRMVLDRCPTVERVEFVGCCGEEEAFLECSAAGIVEYEKVDFGTNSGTDVSKLDLAQSPLWWEGYNRFAEKIDACIEATGLRRTEKCGQDEAVSINTEEVDSTGTADELSSDEFVAAVAPPGYRKCIVLQGDCLKNLRDQWYIHVNTRQRGIWTHG
ncbi:hypothetical protein HDU80_001324 [Chytriomyces hyalinus]|nr:hypothetical protein HDU80_001324 [Chytriomyces hyalinus]